MLSFRTVTRPLFPALAAGLLALAACDDLTEVEEHLEAFGFVVVVDGVEALRHMDADGGTPTLTLAVGAIYEVEIALLDADGHELEAAHDEGEGEEHEDEVVVTIVNTALATWTPEEHADDGTEPEHVATHGELETLTAGSTAAEICLDHEGHCDYEATFTLEVTDPAT